MKNSICVIFLSGILSLFSFKLFIFGIAIFLMNFGFYGFFTTSLVYFSEISSNNMRILGPICFFLAISMGKIFMCLIFYFFENWRFLIILNLIPLLFLTSFLKFFIESPRFLLTQKNFPEAKTSLELIAKINKKILPDFILEEEQKSFEMQDYIAKILKVDENNTFKIKSKKYHFSDIFKYNSLRVRTIIFSILWTLVIFSLRVNNENYDNYSNFLILNEIIKNCVEMIGYLVSGYLALNYPRRGLVKSTSLITGFIFLGFSFFGHNPSLISNPIYRMISICLIISSKIILFIANFTFVVYTIEVFPTCIRHFAIGFFFSLFSFVSIFSLPYIDIYDNISFKNPFIFLGILFFLGAFFMKKLRETYNFGIRDNIIEQNDFLLDNSLIVE